MKEAIALFEWFKKLLARTGQTPPGMITRTCKICGKTFTLPEEVQYWPDCCQACRAKHQPVETITRTCCRCGKAFTFASSEKRWPKYCGACQMKRMKMASRQM